MNSDVFSLLILGLATLGTILFIKFLQAAVRDIVGPDDEEKGGLP